MSLFNQHHGFGLVTWLWLILVIGAVSATLVVWHDPRALLLIVVGGVLAALALALLHHPINALYIAIFLRLLPIDFRIEPAYSTALCLSIAVALSGWFISSLGREIAWNGVLTFMGLWIVWSTLTLLWAPNQVAALQKLSSYAIRVSLLFLVVNQIRTIRTVGGMMRVFRLIGWIMIIGGLYEITLGDYRFGTRLKVLGIDENEFGATLILMLPGVIWPVLSSLGRRRALLMWQSQLFVVSALLLVSLTGSRASILSFILTLLAFSFWRSLRPWAVAGWVIGSGMLLVAPFLLETLLNRLHEPAWGGELGGRAVLWEASWQLIRDHPLTGVGVGNGPLELITYVRSLTSDYNYADILGGHNPLLEVGADTGVPGMLAYIGTCAAAIRVFFSRGSWKMLSTDARQQVLFACVLGFLPGFITRGDTDPLFFVLIALLIIPAQVKLGRRSAAAGLGNASAHAR